MNIVVTGASGFVGTALVRELLGAGHAVTALTRDVGRGKRRLPARCRVLAWNPEGALDPADLRGADAVVHLAGEGVADARWTVIRKRAIRDSRVSTSAALMRALGQLEGAARPRVLISASAIGWYGDRGDTVQTRGPYALWHHTHEFEPDDGGTIIRDRVRYRLPFGALGDAIAGWLVRWDLQAVFDFRRHRIEELMA
jgi:NAD dependent epimerase/dehydratase family enzyme